MTSRRVRWLMLASLLALAGCGSTVATQSSGQLSDASGNLSAPSASVAGTGTAADGGGSLGSGSASSAAAQAIDPGSVAAPASTTAPGATFRDASGIAQGVGVTATSISIGIQDTENADAANKAAGADKVSHGDQRGETEAIIDDINGHGGLAGRKLVPVWHTYDAQSTNTAAQNGEAACADYTQDHKVFAVLDSGPDNLQACLRNAGVLQVFTGDVIRPDNAYFRTYPHYLDLGTMSQERMMADEVRSLVRQNYFGGWNTAVGGPASAPAKIGVLSLDIPSWNRPLDQVLLPALRAAGHPVAATDVYRIHNPESSAEIASSVAEVQNAALKFRNDGVTHVVMLDANGSLALYFAQNTKGQHYFPRLAVNSATAIQALYDSGVVDSAQLNGAVGIGWQPTLDLPAGSSAKYDTKATTQCLAVMARHHFTFTSTNATNIALALCDQLYFLRDVIDAAGRSITLHTVQTVIDRLGARFVPALVPQTFFSATRHDGAELAFDMKWDGSCRCTRYVDSGHHVR